MARLKGLGPRVATLGPRVRALPKVADRFYASPEWRSLVKAIKAERGAWCERCGSTHRLIGDHKVERRDGGADLDPANVELLCQACHNAKTAEARAKRVAETAGGGRKSGGSATQ
ncbi:HNH endonuclease [Qipengyuania sp. 6B39]|uniref:HNH endonuclease signature motif containing protein n=1 Tax=Qipengyuania proteolytica TaxID=2867239 RepID=UPI001C8ACA3B|nr:HNH endonuclease [Qipengyuania proteolytica]MBX7496774.1 HNH endonuclease [Qipengyuania proteolytica]